MGRAQRAGPCSFQTCFTTANDSSVNSRELRNSSPKASSDMPAAAADLQVIITRALVCDNVASYSIIVHHHLWTILKQIFVLDAYLNLIAIQFIFQHFLSCFNSNSGLRLSNLFNKLQCIYDVCIELITHEMELTKQAHKNQLCSKIRPF